MKDEHAQFSGSIPAAYDRYLGPMLFQPYAEDLAARLQVAKNGSVLELDCGTVILTRALRTRLPSTVKLTATDLNEPMFRHAAAKFREDEAVQWLHADACSLPFGDRMFDAVVCQFGIMFVPDKALAAREAHRVLKPGGLFLFNVWDAMEHNELGQLTHQTIASYFDQDPPAFYEVPFGYHDQDEIKRVLKEAGFQEIKTEVVAKVGAASRAEDAATGLVQGNPVAAAIASATPSLLPVITQSVAQAITDRLAAGPTLQALSIEPSVVQIGIGIVTVTLTVTLTEPAPAGGLQVQLTASGNIGLAGALTVPSGATTGQNSREIDTNAVPSRQPKPSPRPWVKHRKPRALK